MLQDGAPALGKRSVLNLSVDLSILDPFDESDLISDSNQPSRTTLSIEPIGSNGLIGLYLRIETSVASFKLIIYSPTGQRLISFDSPSNIFAGIKFYQLSNGGLVFNHKGQLSTITEDSLFVPITDKGGQFIPDALHIDAFDRIYYFDTATGSLKRYQPVGLNSILTSVPKTQNLSTGDEFALSLPLEIGAGATFQWKLNGQTIPGATGPALNLPAVRAGQSGLYSVEVFNQGQQVETEVLSLSVEPAKSYLGGISLRGLTGKDEKTLIAGYVVEGSAQPAAMIARSVGPGLADQDIENPLPETRIHIYADGQLSAGRAGDHSGADILAASTRRGLQALAPGSKDTALLLAQGAGAYGALSSHPGAEPAISLTELYLDWNDTQTLPPTKYRSLSGRGYAAPGEGALIAGFIIEGAGPKTVLIRAAGPALLSQGVADVLADPQITLYQNGQPIASNDDWIPAETQAESARIGVQAFAVGSKDAALIVTLQPGIYGAVLSSSDPLASGVALVEIYDLDD